MPTPNELIKQLLQKKRQLETEVKTALVGIKNPDVLSMGTEETQGLLELFDLVTPEMEESKGKEHPLYPLYSKALLHILDLRDGTVKKH